jgi:hypothetical protein
MAVIKTFPATIARENSILFELTASTITAGQTASGIIPLTRMDGGGLWKASFNDVSIISPDQVRTWRAIAAYCEGGAQPIIVPMCDRRYLPGLLPLADQDTPHSDETPHSDDTPYTMALTIQAFIQTAAPLRSTLLHITFTSGGPFVAGNHFSINHPGLGPRLYRVVEYDGSAICEIRPPLRGPVTASTPIELERPACVMRLATSDAMDLTLTQRKFGSPTVNFIEAFPPFPLGTEPPIP